MSEPPVVIVNPHSALGATGRALDALRRELDRTLAGGNYRLLLTEAPLHATELARQAVQSGAEHLVACGGDGTLSEVVEGIMTSGRAERTVLSPLARGTGSDFARSLAAYARTARPSQLPGRDPRELCIDVGRAQFARADGTQGTRHVLNVASMGLSAESVRWVDAQAKRNKRNRFSYLFSAFAGLARYRVRKVELTVDGALLYRGPLHFAAVANGGFFGGGMPVAPEARLDDGLFEVIAVVPPRPHQILPFFAAFLRGKHQSSTLTRTARAHEVVVTSEGEVWLEIDGDPVGTLPARFEITPGALRVRSLP